MTRKDTILIAVVINAGLLSILFITALIYDTDKSNDQVEFAAIVTDHKEITSTLPAVNTEYAANTNDEVDNVLKYHTQSSPQLIALETGLEFTPEPINVPIAIEETAEFSPPTHENYIEIRVKKGDMLDKIARANGTTSSEIKKINHLQNERLSIGQILKIPVAKMLCPNPIEEKVVSDHPDAVYYIVKQGDNPWKIARQFNIKIEDILKLNQLNEEKARNMKVGDRIRVK